MQKQVQNKIRFRILDDIRYKELYDRNSRILKKARSETFSKNYYKIYIWKQRTP